MADITINDLNEDLQFSEQDLDHVRGGILIGLLLPAVQKVRVASITDGTSIYLAGDGSV